MSFSIERSWRGFAAKLLAGSALVVTPVSLSGSLLAILGIDAAHADGGAGGGASSPNNGGVDSPFDTGGNGTNDNNGGGGGGGGSGGVGGRGGLGDSGTPAAGGGGGQPTNDGADGINAGGGGGGAHGYGGSPLPTASSLGGAGGNGGGPGAFVSNGGGGGAGGFGASVAGTGQLGSLDVAVTGGKGGNGGNSFFYGGNGGSGGTGLLLYNFFNSPIGPTLTINAAVAGGNGGSGGTSSSNMPGMVGAGGAALVGGNVTLVNNATITGGFADGGAGEQANAITLTSGTNTVTNNASGIITGGASIRVSTGGSTVFNAGTINATGGGASRAISFGTNNNTLTLAHSSVINGLVVAGGGSNALQLGGSGAGTFDVSKLGPGQQYQGFDTFNKIDDSIWTLTGTPGQNTSWSINGGALSVSSNANLGAANEAISFNGGVLQVSGNVFTSNLRAINWGANGGGFDIANALNAFALSQAIGPGGVLNKLGAGTLVLSGANTYTGTTTISGGALIIRQHRQYHLPRQKCRDLHQQGLGDGQPH